MAPITEMKKWPLVPLKRFAELVYGDALPAEKREDGGEVLVYGSNGPFGSHSSPNTAAPVILVGRKGSVGAVNWSDDCAFAIDTVYYVDEPHAHCDLRWLYWALQTASLHTLSQDTGVPGLSRDMAYGVAFPLPNREEQAFIARALDRETSKIDGLVDEQRRLVELLKEKRQAVISEAVRRGLDPDVRMKPSGVEWLGDVPEHWEVKRLRFLSDISTGDGDTVDADQDGSYPFYVRSQTIESIGRYSHDCEAVLTSGDGAGVGKIFHHVMGKFAAHQRVYIFHRFREVSGAFFFNYLRENFYKVALSGGAKSTVDSLRRPLIANFWITVPPPREQEAIVREAERLSEEFEQLIGETEQALALLRERRVALIFAAVTGKIDVLHTAARAHVLTDTARVRTLVAAEIIDQLAHKKTFGRVKLQKILYLAEADVGIGELQGQYLREAAGPLDRSLIAEVDAGLQQNQHVTVVQSDGPGGQVVYHLRGKRGAYHDELIASIGDRAASLCALVEKLGDLDTKAVEAVTTLYAVWNDALLDHHEPTDSMVVSGVLEDWHPEKARKFRAEELLTWLGWMRRNKLVPRGNGPRTTTGRLFA